MTPQKSRFWQCQGCGSIYAKQVDSLSELASKMGMTVMGGRTCGTCGARHEVADIYGGKFDMRAPDALLASALQDMQHAAWDKKARVWKYKGQELRGSESFETLKPQRPSNVKHMRSSDGKAVVSTLVVDHHHLAQADATEVEDLLESIETQIRERGSFQPCILTFGGFDEDPRAICQIPEVRRWCAAAWKKAPALVPLIEERVSGTSKMFMFCLLNVKIEQQEGTTANFAITMDEFIPVLRKAAESGAQFLESCGYAKTMEYVTEWVKLFVA